MLIDDMSSNQALPKTRQDIMDSLDQALAQRRISKLLSGAGIQTHKSPPVTRGPGLQSQHDWCLTNYVRLQSEIFYFTSEVAILAWLVFDQLYQIAIWGRHILGYVVRLSSVYDWCYTNYVRLLFGTCLVLLWGCHSSLIGVSPTMSDCNL